ncbi:hypothetical protein Tco_1576144 [Tanacetum coccineum]
MKKWGQIQQSIETDSDAKFHNKAEYVADLRSCCATSSDPSDNIVDDAVHKELGDSLVRVATIASSLEAEQDSGNITKTRSKATPNESSSLGTTSGGGPGEAKMLWMQMKKYPGSVHDIECFSGEESATTVSAATTASAATATTTATNTIVDDITLAQALEEKKITKPKQKGVVIQELDQIRLDEEIALKLQATFDEEERLAREKVGKVEEANIALIETWDAIQAKIDVDHQLAEKMQAQEQEELFIEENATLFQQLLEKKRKHFAAKRA